MGSSADDKPRRIVYKGTYNMALLSEELYAAFPEWIIPDSAMGLRGLGKVEATSDGVRLVFPVTTPRTLVDTVVAAHDPAKLNKNERDKQNRKKLRTAAKKKLKNLGLSTAEIGAIVGPDAL